MRPLALAFVLIGASGACAGEPPTPDAPPPVPAPLTITLEDLTIHLDEGAAIRMDSAVLVLSGKGTVAFAPAPASERRQLDLYCGSPALEDRFEEAYLRVAPGKLPALAPGPEEKAASFGGALRGRAGQFLAEAEHASPYPGELSPPDFLAMVRTRRHGLLAFLRLSSEPEDMMMIDVAHKRRIALYPSAAHRTAFGFDYGDEYGLSYAVSRYDLDLFVDPGRHSLSGEARLTLTALRSLEAAALRLDPALSVSGIRRVPGGEDLEFQHPPGSDRLFVRFDPPLGPLEKAEIDVRYSGWAPPQELEGGAGAGGISREAASPDGAFALFSNRIWWYPQSPVHNHATAILRVRVPPGLTAIVPGMPDPADASPDGTRIFRVDPPARYLALLVGRFVTVSDDPPADLRPAVQVVATPDRLRPARRLAPQVAPILDFLGAAIGKAPFPKLTVAVVGSRSPAAHSPAWLSVIGTPAASFSPEDNPSFDRDEPSFQLAHEIAHQWWGQAVGWRNYRQQWLSEAFAQYFAALYVLHARGPKAFEDVIGWLGRWARRAAGRGTVDLGMRAGAITGEPWLFPAVVYDRGALALDTLRATTGDEAFFRGLRSFYRCRKFDRADTDDFRAAMEAASGRNLGPFFDFWIDGDSPPGVR